VSLAFHEAVVRILQEGKRLVIATVIEAGGSTPRKEGARMAIVEDGRTVDSVGGGALEALVLEDARALLESGGSRTREYLLTEGTTPESTGMVCGGRVRVHLQVELPPDRLVIFGAGHVGAALAALAPGLGFATTVVDDRPELLEPGHFPKGVVLSAAGSEFRGALPPMDDSTYVAVVTRCHRTDLAALRRVLVAPVRYLGMIGSRRKVRVVRERLRSEGFSEERLDALRAPIGLSIGACTPAEIAVSIAGELIQIRRGFAGERGFPQPVPRLAERHLPRGS
jgi:xanthine dehydrogenase accessory factor